MHFSLIIGLVFLFSGVLSAPTDDPSKKNDYPKSESTIQSSAESSLTKKDSSVMSPMIENSDSSLIKDDKDSKPAKMMTGDGSPTVTKNVAIGMKSEMKDEGKVSVASKPEDKNKDDVLKANQAQPLTDMSPGTAVKLDDVKVDNEGVDKKEKEVEKSDTTVTQDGKLTTIIPSFTTQKQGVSQLIGNFVFEMLQAPIYLLKAFKDLIGGMLGIKPVATTTTVAATAPY